jgi:hypothetical protein
MAQNIFFKATETTSFIGKAVGERLGLFKSIVMVENIRDLGTIQWVISIIQKL